MATLTKAQEEALGPHLAQRARGRDSGDIDGSSLGFWARLLLDRFGAYAFGVLAVLMIWFWIVAPELRAARSDASVLLKVQEVQQETVRALDKVVGRIERVADKLER